MFRHSGPELLAFFGEDTKVQKVKCVVAFKFFPDSRCVLVGFLQVFLGLISQGLARCQGLLSLGLVLVRLFNGLAFL